MFCKSDQRTMVCRSVLWVMWWFLVCGDVYLLDCEDCALSGHPVSGRAAGAARPSPGWERPLT
eukprot:scaffold175730_cov29-Tisochrysis_lutea.AAC.1